MAKKEENLFQKLTKLFRSGPVVRRKIRNLDTSIAVADKSKSSGALLFQKSMAPTYATITANAYNLSERLMRYQDFSEMEYTPELAAALDIYADETCLSGDSVIPLLDGTKPTIRHLYESGKQDFWLYSFDIEKNEIVPGQATKVVKTGIKKLFRLTFDDGTFLRLTDNHRVLLSNGEYVHTKNLKIGDSIRSLYTSISSINSGDKLEGYEKVLNPAGWKYTHRVVAECVSPGMKGVVHHVDFNKKNNTPDNLQFMTRRDHQQLHASSNSYKWKSDEKYAEKMSGIFREHALSMHKIPGFTSSFLKRRNEVFASYDKETKKKIFGRPGKSNGMFGKGDILSGENNGRWRDDYVRSVSREQIISWILNGKNMREVCKSLPIKYEDLHQSMICAGIKKWSKKYIVDKNDVHKKLKDWIKFQPESKDLSRFLSKACKEIGVTRLQAYLTLENLGYKNWADYLRKTNHRIVSIEEDGVEEVFDLEVKNWHNFATISSSTSDSYVFVHNCAQDEKGRVLHIYSDNEKIREILEDLFYNTLNVEFNLRAWTRNLVKYGDMFLYNDVSPEHGVINAFPIPVNEIEREENYDPNDPMAVRYRWVTLGNRTLENWEVTHFRLLGNDMFLPYGSSIIEPARRIWRQLILIEDAMLVYRVVRAPERRVFYIDVANIPPENVPMYMEEQKKNLRSSQVIDRNTGRVDLRYNPLPVHKDTPIPLLDGTTLTIENLSKKMGEDPNWIPWVYSVQDETQRVVPGKVIWCGKNYTAKILTKVTLDDGSYITTAPEHPFVMRDGGRKRADELQVGDSLMPLYRKLSSKKDGYDIEGYETVYDPSSESYRLTHRLVANAILSESREHVRRLTDWDINNNLTVHHVDVNRKNNTPENLRWMGNVDHIKLHAETGRARLIAWNKSEKKKKRVSEINKLRNSVCAMSGYNGSELHSSHNEARRTAQKRSWKENSESRKIAMRWNITNEMFESLCKIVSENPEFGKVKIHELLMQDQVFVQGLNCQSLNRDLRKFSTSAWETELIRRGYAKLPGLRKSLCGYKNHKVLSIETLHVEGEDVYCMTVVGPNGEDDRHNFAASGIKKSPDGLSSIAQNDGVFLLNSVDEDYFIPVRGGESGTKIDTLAGGQNAAAVEDVAYIQKKLFAALKIPRAYLGYDEALSSKATLAQEDIRFSRTINVIQKTLVSELNKLAIIHLYANGFDSEDLQNFTLRLSNPSTVAQQQKLELWRAKFEIAGTAPEGQMSKEFIRKEIWGLNDEQCKDIDDQRLKEKIVDQTIENAKPEEEEGGEEGGGGDLFGGGEEEGGEEGGEEEGGGEEGGGEEGGGAEDLFSGDDILDKDSDLEMLISGDNPDDDENYPIKLKASDVKVPVKVQNRLDRVLYNRSRISHNGASKTHMPNFNKMVNSKNKSYNDPYDKEWMSSYLKNPFGESVEKKNKTVVGNDVMSALRNMTMSKKFQDSGVSSSKTKGLISEDLEKDESSDNKDFFISDDDWRES